MISIISPAKTLDLDSKIDMYKVSEPLFLDEAEELINILKSLIPEQIMDLMNISEVLSEVNFKRYQNWNRDVNRDSRQAIFIFSGEVYRGLKAKDFNNEDLEFANKHLKILSGLYGILNPLDIIKPYRLEMGVKLKNAAGKNLYAFWGDKIANYLNGELQHHEDKVLLNLASEEYSKSVVFKSLDKDINVITPIFKEKRGNTYRVIAVYAKKARGLMANYIVKNKIDRVKDIKKFCEEGYEYSEKLSSDNKWIFTR